MFSMLTKVIEYIPGPWNNCPPPGFDNSSVSSVFGLWRKRCARGVLWKDIIMIVVCVVICPVGLGYFVAASIYCIVKDYPLGLVFFPFMRNADFSGRKAGSSSTATMQPDQPLSGTPQLPGLDPIAPTQPLVDPSSSTFGSASLPSPTQTEPTPPITQPNANPSEQGHPVQSVGAGTPNLGNTCYMNACLQVLFRCKLFVGAIRVLCKILNKDAKFDVIRSLGKIFEYYANPVVGEGRIQPCPREIVEDFFNALNVSGAWSYSTNVSMDASEFLMALLNHIEELLNDLRTHAISSCVNMALESNAINESDVAVLRQVKLYQPDEDVDVRADVDLGLFCVQKIYAQEIVDGQPVGNPYEFDGGEKSLVVPVVVAEGSLELALKALTKPERIDGVELRGSSEGRSGSIERRAKFFALPPVLGFHLKRFEYDGTRTQKNDGRFGFPDKLNMTPYTSWPGGSASYELSCIVVHGGTGDGGHYTTYVKIDGEWCKFNDSDVRAVQPSEIETLSGGGPAGAPNAHMLFYAKRQEAGSVQ
ncbi:MAG: hypothetical protein LBB26_04585 [Puniceicoccales bacterium]|nr:hypothetical protein [Puniceicoccales bacterium]